MFCAFSLRNVLRATTACTFSTSEPPKVARTCSVLYIFTSKCTSRHNGVHFFDISSVFCTFWLRNVLRATTACNFSSLLWPAGSAPAALASLLSDPPEPQIIGKNTVFRDFPTFSRICIFCLLTLSNLLFFLLIFLFSLLLPCSAFHLSILSEVWLLNFLRPSSFVCALHLLDTCYVEAQTVAVATVTRWRTTIQGSGSERWIKKTRRRMARERRGAGSSLVSMETPYYKTIY